MKRIDRMDTIIGLTTIVLISLIMGIIIAISIQMVSKPNTKGGYI